MAFVLNDLDAFTKDPVHALLAAQKKGHVEVFPRQLNREQRDEFIKAKDREVKSWLKYNAVEAALRKNYNPADIMKMR